MDNETQTAETQQAIPVEQPVTDWLKFDTDFDFKGTRKYDELAELMPIGASKGGLNREDSVGLVAALERAYGKRTASTFKKDGAFRVQRTEQKPERKINRKGKAPVEGSTEKKPPTPRKAK